MSHMTGDEPRWMMREAEKGVPSQVGVWSICGRRKSKKNKNNIHNVPHCYTMHVEQKLT